MLPTSLLISGKKVCLQWNIFNESDFTHVWDTALLKNVDDFLKKVYKDNTISLLNNSFPLGYSRKKKNVGGGREVEDILFWNYLSPLRNFRFVTLPLEFPEKTSIYSWKFCKIVWHPFWKFQGQKPSPMEIPYEFFFNVPGNFTSLLIDPWNFYVFFF